MDGSWMGSSSLSLDKGLDGRAVLIDHLYEITACFQVADIDGLDP